MSLKYVSALDGVRGIAILMVLLFHLGYIDFGWVGVEVFFVLSGFLITQILVEQKDQPAKDYFKNFYVRRILRIFPIYFTVILIVSIIFVLFHFPNKFDSEIGYLVTYTWNLGNQLAPFGTTGLFNHVWSLCVEEQFYLLWPLAVYFISRKRLRWLVVSIIALGPVLRFVVGAYLTAVGQVSVITGWVYFLPVFQFDAFAAGAAVAIFDLPKQVKLPGLLAISSAVIAVALGVGVGFLTTGKWGLPTLGYPNPLTFLAGYQYVWGYSVLNISSAFLLIYALRGRTASLLLGNRVLKSFGKVSYGMYLYHYPLGVLLFNGIKGVKHVIKGVRPLIPFNRLSLAGAGITILWICGIYLLAYLSFRFYEQRFLSLKRHFELRAAPEIPPEPNLPDTA